MSFIETIRNSHGYCIFQLTVSDIPEFETIGRERQRWRVLVVSGSFLINMKNLSGTSVEKEKKMLERLRICDFQAHKDLRIQLDPKVSVIVGSSDAGKSAVLRALWWLMRNELRGEAFIREGAKACSVYLWADEHKVVRSRGKENAYSLDQQDYKAVNRDVPESIGDLLNVDEVNFQGQHDAPFWLSLSAPEAARRLNDIIDLGVIDRVQTNIASQLRAARASLAAATERQNKAKSEVEQLAYVLEKDRELHELERREIELHEQAEAATRLDKSLHLVQRLNSELQSIKIPDISRLKTRHAAWKEMRRQLTVFQELVSDAIYHTATIERLRQELEQAESELEEMQVDVCPTCGQAWKPVVV
jgi:DNA repair ATPase RecN